MDLLEFVSTCVAEFGARPAEVVRRDTRDASSFGVRLNELPDDFLAEAFTFHL